ncbi:MAG: hypothetical protein JXQ73_07510 [Phycisphaerae bacterium]|nr:hypothetical protein [Phycisphaerae bacterium]
MWTLALVAILCLAAVAPARAADPIDVGSRLEPFVDDFLIGQMQNVELMLHHPTFKNAAIAFDKPWEGNVCCYVTVFKDGDKFRAYYRGMNYDPKAKKSGDQKVCYAESADGKTWTKPDLGLFEYEGSKANNIVWKNGGCHNFAPFKDPNPDCKPDERYKALGSVPYKALDKTRTGLAAFKSPDGIHWSYLSEKPVITKGAFDSQNLAFYDTLRGEYRDYHRGFAEGVRAIMTCTSKDFLKWTDPQWLQYGGITAEHLYTNAITPYPRAPHVFMGFPKRFMPTRRKSDHFHPGVSDAVFMTSRDGLHFKRWQEALIRPGLQHSRWENRNNMTAWGILETASDVPGTPNELSIYTTEGYYVGPEFLRRHTIRLDGFVSVHADYKGGEMITKPLVFKGKHLIMNYSTSAAGSVRVEIQNPAGKPVEGFALADCPEIYGDSVAEPARWKGGNDVGKLAGKPVRLRFVMKDADLYSIRFADD